MLRFLLIAVPAVITLYALIDVILTPGRDMRALPKWVWLLVVLVLPFVGAVLWLVLGRPRAPAGSSPGPGLPGVRRRRGPVAPDDDPAFLRQLGDDAWERRMRARREGDTGPAPHDTTHDGPGQPDAPPNATS